VIVAVLFTHGSGQNTVIFDDYTSGKTFTLPATITNVLDTDYSTLFPGSFNFGVDWNGDAEDIYSFTIPPGLNLTATGTPAQVAFCNGFRNGSGEVIFTNTSIHQCNYTGSWTTPFSAIFSFNYNPGQTGAITIDEAIEVIFFVSGPFGDPQLTGFHGQSYQVHGVDGVVYNIISEKNTQVNARFVFLNEGKCPVLKGIAAANCWSHPGSYLGEMGFQQVVDGKLHKALLVSGSAEKGFSVVQMDGKSIGIGETISYGGFSISMNSSHSVSISMENYQFVMMNSDYFINQIVNPTIPLHKLTSHGLLGQTHVKKIYPSKSIKYIEGDVDDYAIAEDDLFGIDFVYNRFGL